jgi:hypothetical protein
MRLEISRAASTGVARTWPEIVRAAASISAMPTASEVASVATRSGYPSAVR